MMAKITKKIITAFLIMMAALIIVPGYSLSVHATGGFEGTEYDQFLKTLQPVEAKAKPDDNAETIFSYDKDAVVFVTGVTEDGWYIVYYQGQTGYINKKVAQVAEIVQEGQEGQEGQNGSAAFEVEDIDLEALDEEMEAQEMENKLIIEEVERARAETRRSRIWGAVIVLLVIGIFAVGIVSTIRAEKKKKEVEEENNIPENKESDNDEKEKSGEKKSGKKANNLEIIDLDKEKE